MSLTSVERMILQNQLATLSVLSILMLAIKPWDAQRIPLLEEVAQLGAATKALLDEST